MYNLSMAGNDEILERIRSWERGVTGSKKDRYTTWMGNKHELKPEDKAPKLPQTTRRTSKVSSQGNYNADNAMPTGDKD